MNPAHLHLLVNHLPIVGAMFAVPVVALLLLHPAEVGLRRAAALLVILMGLGGIAANSTGEGAEEVVEDLPTVTDALIHEHEERAEIATVIGALAAAAALGLGIYGEAKGRTPRAGIAAVGVLTLATAGAMAWTGASGGLIRHDEIRDGAALSTGGPVAADADQGEDEDGDDD